MADVIQSIDDTLNPNDNDELSITKSIHSSNILPYALLRNALILPLVSDSNIVSQTDVIPNAEFTTSETSDGYPSDTEALMNQTNMASSIISESNHNNNNNCDSDSVTSTTLQRSVSSAQQQIDNVRLSLSTFLVQRASSSLTLANYFYWYLYIECEMQEETTRKQDVRTQNMYKNVLHNLKHTLEIGKKFMQYFCFIYLLKIFFFKFKALQFKNS